MNRSAHHPPTAGSGTTPPPTAPPCASSPRDRRRRPPAGPHHPVQAGVQRPCAARRPRLALAAAVLPVTAAHASPQSPGVDHQLANPGGNPQPPEPPDHRSGEGPRTSPNPADNPEPPLPPDPPDVPNGA